MIVVVDSGIWISALHFGGTPLAALEKALTEDHVAICEQIEEEVARVLSKKLGWEIKRVEESLGIYLQNVIRVPVAGTLHGACRDAKDDVIVECAVNAGASCSSQVTRICWRSLAFKEFALCPRPTTFGASTNRGCATHRRFKAPAKGLVVLRRGRGRYWP